jgi:hypothetical protein
LTNVDGSGELSLLQRLHRAPERKRQLAGAYRELFFGEEWKRLSQSLKLSVPYVGSQGIPFVARSIGWNASVLPAVAANTGHHFPSLLWRQRRVPGPEDRPDARRDSGLLCRKMVHRLAQGRPQINSIEAICHGSLGYAQAPFLLKPGKNQKRYSTYLRYLE